MKIKSWITAGAVAGATLIGGLAVHGVPSAQAQSVEVTTVREGGSSRYHVARYGDTLYDLSARYFGDAMEWPRLWAYNPQITNPHWIYPGDIIFLAPPGDPNAITPDLYSGLYFPLGGFYTSSELEVQGTLTYARTDRLLLAEYDEVYVEFEDRDAVSVGDEFVLNTVLDRVENDDGDVVAVKYLVVGRMQVRAFHEETDLVTCEITDMWEVIERGDVVFATSPQLLIVEPRENTTDLEGDIVDQLRGYRHMHEQDYVFIDLGYDEGVRVGNRFFIWGREDEGVHARSEWNGQRVDYEEDVVPDIPWQLYGEAMVIYASEHYSTAVIVDAGNHEIVTGQRVTLQRGY